MHATGTQQVFESVNAAEVGPNIDVSTRGNSMESKTCTDQNGTTSATKSCRTSRKHCIYCCPYMIIPEILWNIMTCSETLWHIMTYYKIIIKSASANLETCSRVLQKNLPWLSGNPAVCQVWRSCWEWTCYKTRASRPTGVYIYMRMRTCKSYFICRAIDCLDSSRSTERK